MKFRHYCLRQNIKDHHPPEKICAPCAQTPYLSLRCSGLSPRSCQLLETSLVECNLSVDGLIN